MYKYHCLTYVTRQVTIPQATHTLLSSFARCTCCSREASTSLASLLSRFTLATTLTRKPYWCREEARVTTGIHSTMALP